MDATGSEVISTKVSPWAYEALKRAAQRLETNPYSLLQTFIDCLLRYIDDWGGASSDLRNLMQMTVGNFGYLLCQTGISNVKEKPMELDSSIMFVHEKGKDPNHQTVVWCSQSFMGKVKSTFNIQQMFEKFLRVAMPTQYHRLNDVAKANDMSSLIEAFNYLLLREDGETEAEASVRALFSDNERVGFGGSSLSYANKFKEKHHYTIDTANVNRTKKQNNNGKGQNLLQLDLFNDVETDP